MIIITDPTLAMIFSIFIETILTIFVGTLLALIIAILLREVNLV